MPKKKRNEVILVIDDSPDTLEVLHRTIEYMGFAVYSCDNAKDALKLLDDKTVDLVVTDYHMPFVGGIDVIRHVRDNFKQTEVMMITGYASVEGAIEAVKAGAEEYLAKPFTDEELEESIERSLEKLSIRQKGSSTAASNLSKQYGLYGDSVAMKRVFESIKKAAANSHPVLISGESGTGKALAARAVHYESSRTDFPFIYVNCRGISDSLFEGEIFGIFRSEGRHTAKLVKPGFLEIAGEGTVFFDEISALTQASQVKLLRALSSNEITYVGDTEARSVHCRVIASTEKDLYALSKRSLFREDLLYKLNVLNIAIPSLCDREKDVLLLCGEYFNRACAEKAISPVPEFSEACLEAFLQYRWPGNIRELERLMFVLAENVHGPQVEAADLPKILRFTATDTGKPIQPLRDIEREYIKVVLEKCEGNKTRAAELLGIDRKTLREKLLQR